MLAVLLVALEVVCRLKLVNPFTMVSPSQFTLGLFNLIAAGDLNQEILATLASIAVAAIASIVVGAGCGLALYKFPRLRRALDPYLASYYAIPTFIFYPVMIVFFGVNRMPIIAVGFLHAFVSMAMNTVNGLDRIPPVLTKTSRVLQLTAFQTVREVIFPSVMPYLLTGVKFAFAYSIVGVIGAEFIMSSAGLGYQISYAFANFDNTNMYGLILLVVILVVAINSVLFRFERHALIKRGLA
jgi:NitT/TauT family transport system permease protein